MSVFAFVFSRGLSTRPVDLAYFTTRWRLLLRSFLAVNVAVPLITMTTIALIGPQKPTIVGLIILASSPAAPLVLRAISQAGGKREYAVSLQVLMAAMAIAVTPVTLDLLSGAIGLDLGANAIAVADSIGMTVLLPLLLGIGAGVLFPALAARFTRPLEAVSTVILLILYSIVLLSTYRLILLLDVQSYAAMALTVIGALAAGHLLAAGSQEERTTLAIESASRNSGLALLIASTFVPLEKALPVLIPYVIASASICSLYVWLRKIGRGMAHPVPDNLSRPSTSSSARWPDRR